MPWRRRQKMGGSSRHLLQRSESLDLNGISIQEKHRRACLQRRDRCWITHARTHTHTYANMRAKLSSCISATLIHLHPADRLHICLLAPKNIHGGETLTWFDVFFVVVVFAAKQPKPVNETRRETLTRWHQLARLVKGAKETWNLHLLLPRHQTGCKAAGAKPGIYHLWISAGTFSSRWLCSMEQNVPRCCEESGSLFILGQ